MYKRDKFHFLTTQVGYDKYKVPIFEASARNKCVPLLKTLLSSHCKNDCKFCVFRCERKIRRERWEPNELAKVTMKVWKDGRIQGLFLSSSVEKDPNQTVEKEIETVKILRNIGFTSYIHLRLMPGVDRELIKQSVELADRVGINIEFPKSGHYNDMKIFLNFKQDLIKRLKWLSHEIGKVQKEGKCKAGLDSQMVVGASDETDKEILKVSDWLYNKLNARRVYYSGFDPIKNTPLENKPPGNKWREYRLYQCSFLIQRYGFKSEDFVLNGFDKLPTNYDPKYMIAKRDELNVDVNNVDFEELIKVPGIGIKTANKILEMRNLGMRFNSEKDFRKAGVIFDKAQQFIKLNKPQKTLHDFKFNLN